MMGIALSVVLLELVFTVADETTARALPVVFFVVIFKLVYIWKIGRANDTEIVL